MSKIKINSSDEPIRLFNSDFLEYFTHVSPMAVLVIWLLVVGFFIYRTLSMNLDKFNILPVGMILGVFLWTVAEYLLHR